jgi:ribosomal protein L40E
MECPKCQFENLNGMNFCDKCGAKLKKLCPECNFSNPLQYEFCGKCGQNLTLPSKKGLLISLHSATINRLCAAMAGSYICLTVGFLWTTMSSDGVKFRFSLRLAKNRLRIWNGLRSMPTFQAKSGA